MQQSSGSLRKSDLLNKNAGEESHKLNIGFNLPVSHEEYFLDLSLQLEPSERKKQLQKPPLNEKITLPIKINLIKDDVHTISTSTQTSRKPEDLMSLIHQISIARKRLQPILDGILQTGEAIARIHISSQQAGEAPKCLPQKIEKAEVNNPSDKKFEPVQRMHKKLVCNCEPSFHEKNGELIMKTCQCNAALIQKRKEQVYTAQIVHHNIRSDKYNNMQESQQNSALNEDVCNKYCPNTSLDGQMKLHNITGSISKPDNGCIMHESDLKHLIRPIPSQFLDQMVHLRGLMDNAIDRLCYEQPNVPSSSSQRSKKRLEPVTQENLQEKCNNLYEKVHLLKACTGRLINTDAKSSSDTQKEQSSNAPPKKTIQMVADMSAIKDRILGCLSELLEVKKFLDGCLPSQKQEEPEGTNEEQEQPCLGPKDKPHLHGSIGGIPVLFMMNMDKDKGILEMTPAIQNINESHDCNTIVSASITQDIPNNMEKANTSNILKNNDMIKPNDILNAPHTSDISGVKSNSSPHTTDEYTNINSVGNYNNVFNLDNKQKQNLVLPQQTYTVGQMSVIHPNDMRKFARGASICPTCGRDLHTEDIVPRFDQNEPRSDVEEEEEPSIKVQDSETLVYRPSLSSLPIDGNFLEARLEALESDHDIEVLDDAYPQSEIYEARRKRLEENIPKINIKQEDSLRHDDIESGISKLRQDMKKIKRIVNDMKKCQKRQRSPHIIPYAPSVSSLPNDEMAAAPQPIPSAPSKPSVSSLPIDEKAIPSAPSKPSATCERENTADVHKKMHPPPPQKEDSGTLSEVSCDSHAYQFCEGGDKKAKFRPLHDEYVSSDVRIEDSGIKQEVSELPKKDKNPCKCKCSRGEGRLKKGNQPFQSHSFGNTSSKKEVPAYQVNRVEVAPFGEHALYTLGWSAQNGDWITNNRKVNLTNDLTDSCLKQETFSKNSIRHSDKKQFNNSEELDKDFIDTSGKESLKITDKPKSNLENDNILNCINNDKQTELQQSFTSQDFEEKQSTQSSWKEIPNDEREKIVQDYLRFITKNALMINTKGNILSKEQESDVSTLKNKLHSDAESTDIVSHDGETSSNDVKAKLESKKEINIPHIWRETNLRDENEMNLVEKVLAHNEARKVSKENKNIIQEKKESKLCIRIREKPRSKRKSEMKIVRKQTTELVSNVAQRGSAEKLTICETETKDIKNCAKRNTKDRICADITQRYSMVAKVPEEEKQAIDLSTTECKNIELQQDNGQVSDSSLVSPIVSGELAHNESEQLVIISIKPKSASNTTELDTANQDVNEKCSIKQTLPTEVYCSPLPDDAPSSTSSPVMWALARVNILDDGSKTLEILQPLPSPPDQYLLRDLGKKSLDKREKSR